MQIADLLTGGPIFYDGTQLRHAFAYETADVLGDSIAVFEGGALVREHMVDIEDVKASDYIVSKSMVHFVIEIFGASLRETVFCQRLFIQQIAQGLRREMGDHHTYFVGQIETDGDDIFLVRNSKREKMSVSISTLSPFSGLIHVGINIDPGPDCPVAAAGLTSSGVIPYPPEVWARCIAQEFVREFNDITQATYKVKGV